MRRDLEAVLFATDQPLSIAKLGSLFPRQDRKKIREAIEELRKEYDEGEHAFTIVEYGGGFSIATRPEHAPVVKKLFRGKRKLRLSKAGLEVLSIIAYKQPVTRIEIEDIRGVSVSGVLGTLMERELVAIEGRTEGLGNPLLYGTTRNFLEYLGLRDLKELPQLSELEDLLGEREQIKQLAARFGHDVTDDELEAAARGPEPEGELEVEPEDEEGLEDDDPSEEEVDDEPLKAARHESGANQ